MNARQKKFVLEKLIPFILREHGRGFVMETWIDEIAPGEKFTFDGLQRTSPNCGTVCCIGGSIDYLKKNGNYDEGTAALIGLSEAQGYALFHGWFSTTSANRWPRSYQTKFKKAKTTLGKAKVACALLREVVKTDGHCLITFGVLE